MKYLLLIALFISSLSNCNADVIDSLQNILPQQSGQERIKTLNKLSEAIVYTDPQISLKYGQEAYELAEQSKLIPEKYKALKNIGYANGYLGNYSKSIQNMQDGLDYYRDLKDSVKIAEALSDIGYLKIALSDFSSGIDYYHKALEIREKINDQKGLSYSFNNLGTVYWQWGKLELALKYYQKALPYLKEKNLKEEYATILGNIGVIYSDQKNHEKALDYYNQCLKLYTSLKHNIGIAKMQSNMANVYLDMKEYEKAIDLLDQSIKIRTKIGDKEGLALALLNIGHAYHQSNQIDKAINHYLEALNLTNKIGHKVLLPPIYEGLSEAYEEKQDYRKSHQYFKYSKQLNDSIFNEEKHRQIEELKTKYETEKKELHITNLEQENEHHHITIKRKQLYIYIILGISLLLILIVYLYFSKRKYYAELKSLELEQKLMRLQMNPHFIFNSVSVIQSYIYNSNKEDAVNYLSKFAGLMRLILENSITEFIPFEKEIQTLKFYLNLQSLRYPDKFRYTINIDEKIDQENLLIPPMLGQPFIENAIEHGLKNMENKGELTIDYKASDNCIIFSVEDNGMGILKSKKVRDADKHQSLAINITKERLSLLNKKLKSKLDFEILDKSSYDSNQSGTIVKFKIPVKSEF